MAARFDLIRQDVKIKNKNRHYKNGVSALTWNSLDTSKDFLSNFAIPPQTSILFYCLLWCF